MAESLNVVPIFARRLERGVKDFMIHPDIGRGERRVVWYNSPQRGGPVSVLISWEAQCAVAGSVELTTDEIFGRYAGEFDRQIALMIARKGHSRGEDWTLDADDIVVAV